MSIVKATIIDEYTLRLESDAKKGDLVNIKDTVFIDTSIILKKIEEEKDKIYQDKLKEYHEKIEAEFKLLMIEKENKLINQIALLKKDLESKENEITNNLETKYLNKLKDKDLSYAKLENSIELLKKDVELTITKKYDNELNIKKEALLKLENEYKLLSEQNKINLLSYENTYSQKINSLKLEIDNLKRERSNLTIKRIGEDLESWCDNQFRENNLLMPNYISWTKDNDISDKTKGDFIYKVYGDNSLDENFILSSVMLEMKSEDPNAPNKQNLSNTLKKLDSDRNKKKLEYAILVSELDWHENNNIAIERVTEYDKMFIVRPPYFITLLNIITAFGLKYKDILTEQKREEIKFKDLNEINDDFNKMKDDILDVTILNINKNIDIILKESENITKANEKLLSAANTILNTHLETVKNKIRNFKIRQITKRIEQLDK
ncbi:DUF2130 domain-containing protein [Haploplasma modicum]|uniref:DUF2130 domain-containing protein n=1 Tax=Haploplasma modicum TaxID=2150 RepID=UPI00138B11DC|nr:DUF2130 domain-containing protein [Haploplasma modicum]